MAKRKWIIALVGCVALFCLWGLFSCKRPCKHITTHSQVTVEPTCTATGVSTVYCDDCNAVIRNDTINARGHDCTVLLSEVPVDCINGGSKTLKCSRCDVTDVVNSDALGHDYSVFVRETFSTCSVEGEKIYKCSRCQSTTSTKSDINPSAHDYGEWTLSKAPTLNQNGVFVKICKNNSAHTETKAIPSLSTSDVYNVTVTKQATCNQTGTSTYSSEVYGTYTVDIPSIPHTFDPDRESICKVCNNKYYSANLKYDLSVDETYYTVSLGQATDNNVVIPSLYNGIPVKAIASEGFAYKTWIHSITIPEYIEDIGSGAFNGSGITKVNFNAIRCNDLKSKNWAFLLNTNVEVIIGHQVEHIPARLFYPLVTTDRTVNVTKLTFEQGSVCKSIGEYAFNKTSITSLILPDSVQSIGDYAFYNTQITKLVLGNGVISLGNSCFGTNSKLSEVVFGKNLVDLSNDCFNYCAELVKVDLSATKVTMIGDDAFKGCTKLATVILPDSLLSIGKQAFLDCTELQNLSLGNGLQTIGQQAFANCVNLTKLTLPKSVKDLGNAAFNNCVNLCEINFNAVSCKDLSASNMVFANIGSNGKLTVTFGEDVQYIPKRLFYCSANAAQIPQIDSLKLGANITQIGDYAFMGVNINSVLCNGLNLSAIVVGSGNATLTNAVK